MYHEMAPVSLDLFELNYFTVGINTVYLSERMNGGDTRRVWGVKAEVLEVFSTSGFSWMFPF